MPVSFDSETSSSVLSESWQPVVSGLLAFDTASKTQPCLHVCPGQSSRLKIHTDLELGIKGLSACLSSDVLAEEGQVYCLRRIRCAVQIARVMKRSHDFLF